MLGTSKQVIRALVAQGANVRYSKNFATPLWNATESRQHEAMRELLRLGSGIGVILAGCPVIGKAKRCNDMEAAKILMRAGANKNHGTYC